MKTKTKTKRVPKAGKAVAARKGRARKLPNDACPTCGTMMEPRVGPRLVKIHGDRFTIPSVRYLECPSCGEGMIGAQEAIREDREAVAAYRKKYNLLAPDEVRAVREGCGLTVAELAALLRVTEFEASRWESGRAPQSATMDTLLRMIRDVPGSIDYLRKRAA